MTIDDSKPSPESSEKKSAAENKPVKKKKAKQHDWKPLGHVRDSFAEQIRQDEKFR